MIQNNTLHSTAALLANIAIETQNYLTDVLHHIKASGVAEIINEFESGKSVGVEEAAARYRIPDGGRAYGGDYADNLRKGCAAEADEIAGSAQITPDRYVEALIRQLIFWEVEHTPLHIETFECRFPLELREAAFYREVYDSLLEKLPGIFKEVEEYRNRADVWAQYYAFAVAEKHSLIALMLVRHGYRADAVAPIFRGHDESVRALCELIEVNNCFEEETI